MKERFQDAYEELKRIDHLIHVSLKYTRTVDVLISVLIRFISCIDAVMESLMMKAKEDEKISEIPETPFVQAKKIIKLYDDQIIKDMMNEYLLFRRLIRAKYTRREEFRRYVTMTADDNGTFVEIDIDKVVEYHEQLENFLAHVSKML